MQRPIPTTAKDFPRMLRQRLEADTKLLEAAALETANRGVHEAVRLTDSLDLVDQAQYKNSWKAAPIAKGATLANDAPHAATIEYGRRPNRPGPPLAPIREWVRRKLVGNGEVAEEDAEHVAFLIRLSIHRKGSPPHFVLRSVVKQLGPWFREAAVQALRRRARQGG
jgi:hypothetical protein